MGYKLQRHIYKKNKNSELSKFDVDFLQSYPEGKINVGDITGRPIISMVGLRALPKIFEVYGYIEEYPYSSEVTTNVPYKYLSIDVEQIKKDDRASGAPHYAYVLHKEVLDELYEYLQSSTPENMLSPLSYIYDRNMEYFKDEEEYFSALKEEFEWIINLDKKQLRIFPENYTVRYMCYPSLSWAFAYGENKEQKVSEDDIIRELINTYHIFTLAESISYLENLSMEKDKHVVRLAEITDNKEYETECENLVERLDAIDIEEKDVHKVKTYYESEGLKILDNSV